jgi:hypothetical protein
MSILLINGDSYLLGGITEKFAKQVNCSSVVNLACGGNSNRAIIRTTIKYLESNLANFVLIGLTFWSRFELSNKQQWLNYSASGIIHPLGLDRNELLKLNKYIENRFIYDYDDYMYAEQTIYDILMLSSYLKQRSIKFCIYNSSQIGYNHVRQDLRESLEKIDNIIPLDKFVANAYLFELGAESVPADKNLPAQIRHYKHRDYYHLENYLYDYCANHNII